MPILDMLMCTCSIICFEALETFQTYQTEVEKELDKKITVVPTLNGQSEPLNYE